MGFNTIELIELFQSCIKITSGKSLFYVSNFTLNFIKKTHKKLFKMFIDRFRNDDTIKDMEILVKQCYTDNCSINTLYVTKIELE